MQVKMEFVAKQSFLVKAGSFFKAMLILDKLLVPTSRTVTIFSHDEVISKNESFLALGSQANTADCRSVKLNYSLGDSLDILIYNDIFFSPEDVQNALFLRLCDMKGQTMDFPLKRCDWLGRGSYLVNISSPMHRFCEMLTKK